MAPYHLQWRSRIVVDFVAARSLRAPLVARALPHNAVGTELTHFSDLIEHAHFTDLIKCESSKEDRKHHRAHTYRCVCDEFEQLLKHSTLFIAVGKEA